MGTPGGFKRFKPSLVDLDHLDHHPISENTRSLKNHQKWDDDLNLPMYHLDHHPISPDNHWFRNPLMMKNPW